jgi:hypothetical protein
LSGDVGIKTPFSNTASIVLGIVLVPPSNSGWLIMIEIYHKNSHLVKKWRDNIGFNGKNRHCALTPGIDKKFN